MPRGPIVIDSFLARLAILPWGNCKTYSISCSWWILCVSKVWHLLEDHVNAISKHVYGTPIFNKNIWSTMLNFIHQLFKHRCLGNIILLPLPKWFPTLYPVMDIMLYLSLGRIYPWNMCLNIFFFPLFWLNLIDAFPFPLVCLNPYCDPYDIAVIIPCWCNHLGVQLCQ